MSFINLPLNTLQNTCYYKMWLVSFQIDIDCIKVIKNIIYKLYVRRTFTRPSLEEMNNNLFYHNKHYYHVNNQGIVFKSRKKYKIKEIMPIFTSTYMMEIFTARNCHSNNIQANNVSSVLVSFYPYHIFTIDIKLSGINHISVCAVNNDSKCYHQILNNTNITVI